MVSGEKFDLLLDDELDMLVTFPQPKIENLASYYKSETYISHTDANKSLFDKVYQLVKKHTIKQKIKWIESFELEEKTILDIGCGTGDFLEACKNSSWKVTGIEPNEAARNLSIKKVNQNVEADIKTLLDEKKQMFDVITMWHVLEHVTNLKEYTAQLKKLLKPKGILVIAVPNYKSYDAKHYGKFWAAYDVPRHLWHFSQKSIEVLFSKLSLELIKTIPMKFDSYYVSLLSEKNKTKTGNPLKAFYNGFKSNRKAKRDKEYSSLVYILKNHE